MPAATAVIGTGRMGSALATALHKAGFPTSVWNRTAAKTEPLVRLGMRAAGSLTEAVQAADVVIVIVSDYATSGKLLQATDVTTALRGKTVVQLTSGTPHDARRAESWASQHGIAYLDGAVMSYPSGVGTPECTIFYSGPKEAFERAKPALMALGGNSTHVGTAVGHASALDMAGLSFVIGAMFGFVSGFIVCKEEGIPPDAFMASIKSLVPATEQILAGTFDAIQRGRYAGDEATIEAWSVGPRELIEWCAERGIRHELASAQQQLFNEAMRSGHGQDDFAYFYQLMRAAKSGASS